MENSTAPVGKVCRYCKKEIDAKAKHCPHCQGDLRNWVVRHPIWSVFIALGVLWVIGASLGGSQPSSASQNATPTNTVDALMAQNSPTIKELATVPKDYVGKSFTLYVYAEDDRYYNYGFSDEDKYYSLKLTDNSSEKLFDFVYGYVLKNAQSQDLVNRALNGPVLIKAQVTIPASKWEDSSNAFLQIDSWEYQ
jgi:hypothetical protein